MTSDSQEKNVSHLKRLKKTTTTKKTNQKSYKSQWPILVYGHIVTADQNSTGKVLLLTGRRKLKVEEVARVGKQKPQRRHKIWME